MIKNTINFINYPMRYPEITIIRISTHVSNESIINDLEVILNSISIYNQTKRNKSKRFFLSRKTDKKTPIIFNINHLKTNNYVQGCD